MFRPIMVIDFETDSPDPETCNPVQLSALVIDSKKLEIINGSEFDIIIKPDDIDTKEYFNLHEQTINWHAKLRNKSPQEIVDTWKIGIDSKTAIKTFVQYVEKWNPKKNSSYTACSWAGCNPEFDITILKRYCLKYKINTKSLFWWRDTFNITFVSWLLLHRKNDAPIDYKMDTLREYFGISLLDAHNSLVDVQDEAKLLIRYLRYLEKITEKTTFRNAFSV